MERKGKKGTKEKTSTRSPERKEKKEGRGIVVKNIPKTSPLG